MTSAISSQLVMRADGQVLEVTHANRHKLQGASGLVCLKCRKPSQVVSKSNCLYVKHFEASTCDSRSHHLSPSVKSAGAWLRTTWPKNVELSDSSARKRAVSIERISTVSAKIWGISFVLVESNLFPLILLPLEDLLSESPESLNDLEKQLKKWASLHRSFLSFAIKQQVPVLIFWQGTEPFSSLSCLNLLKNPFQYRWLIEPPSERINGKKRLFNRVKLAAGCTTKTYTNMSMNYVLDDPRSPIQFREDLIADLRRNKWTKKIKKLLVHPPKNWIKRDHFDHLGLQLPMHTIWFHTVLKACGWRGFVFVSRDVASHILSLLARTDVELSLIPELQKSIADDVELLLAELEKMGYVDKLENGSFVCRVPLK